MKLRLLAATLAAMTLVAGSAFAQSTPVPNKNDLSYALGYDLGRNLVESGEAVDINTVVKAVQEGYAKKEPTVPVAQLRTAVEAMQKRQMEKAKAEFDKASAENKTKSDAYISQYRSQAGVKTLPSGALYKVLTNGTGAKPTMASTVQLQVSGPFPWGQRPAQAQAPQTMPDMKLSAVEMPAMRDALAQMTAGSKWEIALPPDKAYGADPRTGFPPNVAVVFEVTLVSVK